MATLHKPGTTLTVKLVSMLSGMVMAAIVASIAPLNLTVPDHDIPRAGIAVPVVTTEAPDANPKQRAITAYLAREWNLEHSYAAEVAAAVLSSANKHHLDPSLLLAVAATESSLQHTVGNPGGGTDPRKPYGIMQVAGQYHVEKFPGGVVKRTTVDENVDIGAQVLKEYLALEDGNERRALLRYNGSLNVSDKYFSKVNSLKQKFLKKLTEYQFADRT